jgi:hypothetical protein
MQLIPRPLNSEFKYWARDNNGIYIYYLKHQFFQSIVLIWIKKLV